MLDVRRCMDVLIFQLSCRITHELTVILYLEFCISMFINFYIASPTYRFILIYTCGLTAVIKRICYYVMLLLF